MLFHFITLHHVQPIQTYQMRTNLIVEVPFSFIIERDDFTN
jgi:hypothetical protein